MPKTIKISPFVTLVLQPAGLEMQPFAERQHILRLLRTAKSNALIMVQLRSALDTPASHLSDDEVLEAVATAILTRKIVLRQLGPCSSDKRRFFDWLAAPLAIMAKDLNTTQQIMLTLAVKEGGWNKPALDHNQPLNNPFGMNLIKDGKAAGNIKYATVADAVAAWKRSHSYVSGITDPRAFVDILLAHHYNTVNKHYADEFIGRYADVGRAMVNCEVGP